MTRSRGIGTGGENDVVKYLIPNGFPYAERRALHGSKDLGDITGTPGLVWEVKCGKAAETAGDALIEKWMAETEAERVNANADIGVLITKRKGYGSTRVGDWWAWLPSWQALAVAGGCHFPIRMKVSDYLKLLEVWGYIGGGK